MGTTIDEETERARNEFKDSGLEAWVNVTPSRVQLWRIGDFGVEKPELIGPDRVIHMTPAERRLNENKVARPEYNPFTNGKLKPLHLIEGDRDYERLTNNPNILTDQEVERIFKLKGEAFRNRIALIGSLPALERLLALALEPASQAYVYQLQMVERRLAEVHPQEYEETESVGPEHVRSETGRAVTLA